jgi:Protein of unknown function DUF262
MKTIVEIWTIKELYENIDNILEQPKYQRGAVWKEIKKQVLVDSILRGVDIPKIYLRKLKSGIHKYEVADGQQRIIAIREFIDKKFLLSTKSINGLELSKIGSYKVGDKNIDEINHILKDEFFNYNLTIAIVEDATNIEIRTLFGRLQMGDTLNPAEKRNALISNIGMEIDNIVLNHDFFIKSKIQNERYKKQDFLTHVITLIYFQNKYDLKAPLLNQLYIELSKDIPEDLISNTIKCLNHMYEIDKLSKKRIVNKWTFVDLFYYLYLNLDTLKSIDYGKVADSIYDFENSRIKHSPEPERLIDSSTSKLENKLLYNYIVSFKANGGNPKNINKRNEMIKTLFKNK